MKGGEAHAYEVSLAADQFLWIIVDQRGIDVGVTATDPQDSRSRSATTPTARLARSRWRSSPIGLERIAWR